MLYTKLLELINNILNSGEVPNSFTNSIDFPLHKEGYFKINFSVNNYRENSFMNAMSKLFKAILLNHFNDRIETSGVLKEFQAGLGKKLWSG